MDKRGLDARERPVINIEGERVALGPLRVDLVPLYQRWSNDWWVQRTFGGEPEPISLEVQRERFERQVKSGSNWFTIYERETWAPIGTTDLFDVDQRLGAASYGVQIGEPSARGKGYGTEVTRLMLDYAFTALRLHNVMLSVAEFNLAGRRAYEKAGFKEFGRRREYEFMDGRWWDEIFMDCLATEFESPVLAKVFVADEPR